MTDRISYIRFFHADWQQGCADMSPMAEWCYLQICLYIWDKGKALTPAIARLRLIRDRDWEHHVDELVALEKVKLTPEGYMVRRAASEHNSSKKSLKLRKKAGKKGAENRWKNKDEHGSANGDATDPANGNQSQNQNQTDTNVSDSPFSPPPKKKSTPGRKSALPDNFEPIHTNRAKEVVDSWPRGMYERELDKFKDYHTAKRTLYVDWQAAFRTWIANAEQWRTQNDDRHRSNTNGFADAVDEFGD